jgi:hypothetical protein
MLKNISLVAAYYLLLLLASFSFKAEEITTENLLGKSADTNINDVTISGTDYGMTGAEFTTGNENLGGGSRTFDIDLSEYENIDLIEYGSNVYSHTSNQSLPICSNTTGDCRDEFKITVNLYNDNVLVKTYTHNYYDIDWSGTKSYNYSQTTIDLVFNSAELELYGMDAGYPNGYFGPGFSNPYFKATYEVIDIIINEVLTSVEMNFIESTVNIYEDFTVDIQFEDIQGDVVSVEFDMITPETFDVQIEEPVIEEIMIEPAVEEIEIEMDMTDMVEELDVEIEVAQMEPDSEDAPELTVETEEEGEQEVVQQSETKEEVAQKIMVRLTEVENQIVLNNIKLAVMSQLADTKAFEAYTTKYIVDNNVDQYLLQTIEDPYGILFSNAQDQLMNQMVESQYGGN